MSNRSILLISLSILTLLAAPPSWAQGTLKGTVTDANGDGIAGATVKAGELTTTTAGPPGVVGSYEIQAVPAGSVTVEFTADWFEDKSEQAEVTDGTETTLDVTLDAKALMVVPDDKAIEEAYNQTFDWTTDKLSITYIAPPTRANIDKGLYFRNPALYKDTSAEPAVTVSEWDFPIPEGAPNVGQQAFEADSIVHSICDTPLTKEERDVSLLWEPAVDLYLVKWDINKSEGLYYVNLAVKSQKWGGSGTLAPQTLQHVYLHEGEIWVEVVFEKYVEFDTQATDSDGDGYKEIFAKVAASHFTPEVYTKLATDYPTTEFNTLELRGRLDVMLDDLYSTTDPNIISVIGVPYDVPGHGTIQYPFLVLEHSNSAVNVLLVDSVTPELEDACASGDGGCGCSASSPGSSQGSSSGTSPGFVLFAILALLAASQRRKKHL